MNNGCHILYFAAQFFLNMSWKCADLLFHLHIKLHSFPGAHVICHLLNNITCTSHGFSVWLHFSICGYWKYVMNTKNRKKRYEEAMKLTIQMGHDGLADISPCFLQDPYYLFWSLGIPAWVDDHCTSCSLLCRGRGPQNLPLIDWNSNRRVSTASIHHIYNRIVH